MEQQLELLKSGELNQQSPQYNPNYMKQYHVNDDKEKPLSIGQFMVIELISLVPILNLIVMLIWAFGSNINTNKRNCSRARLIISTILAVMIVIIIIIY